MTTTALIWTVTLVMGIISYYIDSYTGRFFRCFLFHACSGLAALAGLWAAGKFIAISLAVTPFSIAAAAIFGIPGALAMLIAAII